LIQFLWQLLFSLFSLVKNNGERKRKRENKRIMWVWERKLLKNCHKLVVQISFLLIKSLKMPTQDKGSLQISSFQSSLRSLSRMTVTLKFKNWFFFFILLNLWTLAKRRALSALSVALMFENYERCFFFMKFWFWLKLKINVVAFKLLLTKLTMIIYFNDTKNVTKKYNLDTFF